MLHKLFTHSITLFRQDYILMPHMAKLIFRHTRLNNAITGDKAVIYPGYHPTMLRNTLQVSKFYIQNRSLQRVKATIIANIYVMIPAVRTIVCNRTNSLCKLFIVGCHSSSITQRTNIFRRIKTKTSSIAKSAGSTRFAINAGDI